MMKKKIIRECGFCKSVVEKKENGNWEKEKSFVVIDLKNTNYTCGITGIVEASNIRTTNGMVYCATCSSVLYKESERIKLLN